ncbi:MAG: tyrosine-type recombinase/integrase [Actinomycetota bacterium]|nr:tyrosine-type recombinase/integrase [Actinomycetota bacterium]
MTDPVEAFITYAQRDRRRSVHTLTRYRAVLAQLTQYGDPLTIDREAVEAWWESRYDLSPATRANELACCRAFYRWATKFDHRTDDPTRRLDAPKVPNRVPRPIGETDVHRLLGPLTDDALDLRRAVALGNYAGLRVSEAAGLDWSMIDQEARRIYIRGKGAKERVFGLSPLLLDKLLPDTGGNVVTAGAKPYSGPVLQRKVNRLMERNGIKHTFHDLRKRGATIVLNRGISPFAVSHAFGWASIQTAQAYAVVSDETLDQIASAIS